MNIVGQTEIGQQPSMFPGTYDEVGHLGHGDTAVPVPIDASLPRVRKYID